MNKPILGIDVGSTNAKAYWRGADGEEKTSIVAHDGNCLEAAL